MHEQADKPKQYGYFILSKKIKKKIFFGSTYDRLITSIPPWVIDLSCYRIIPLEEGYFSTFSLVSSLSQCCLNMVESFGFEHMNAAEALQFGLHSSFEYV
jgi:hypothetical protein